MKHFHILPALTLLILSAIPSPAMIPVVDAGAISQLAAQTAKLGEQLSMLKQQLGTMGNILNINEQNLAQTTQIMRTLGTTQAFKDANLGMLRQLTQLSSGMNLAGGNSGGSEGNSLNAAGILLGGGGMNGASTLLEGFAGLTEPLAKVASTAGKYGDQIFDIFSTGEDIYSTAQGMMDGSVSPVEGGISIVKNLFGGGGNGMQQRLTSMSDEQLLQYGANGQFAAASMWSQALLNSAQKQYQDQIALAQQREKLREMASKADTQADHLAVQNQLQLLQAEQQAQLMNLQAAQGVSGAAAQEAAAQIRQQEQARRMGFIQATRFQ